MEDIFKAWKKHEPVQLKDTPYIFNGWSWAAFRTSFEIPELDLLLDAGLPYNGIAKMICITHTHSDHVQNLPQLLIEAKHQDKEEDKPLIFVPMGSKELVFNYIDAFYRMSTHATRAKLKIHYRYRLEEVKPGMTIEMDIKKKKYIVEIFKCFHTVGTVGYGFTELRRKLKKEYLELPGREIGKLRKEGIDIYTQEAFPQFCYLGDSTCRQFVQENIFNYSTIICECTFIKDEDIEHAKKDRHTHWKNLKPIIEAHPDNTFILYHFSRRYKSSVIREFFQEDLKTIKNMIVWV